MELSIRYENIFETVTVNIAEMEGWLNISVDTDATMKEREANVQHAFDVRFNRPDYNPYHRETRHRAKTPKTDKEEVSFNALENVEDTAYSRRMAEKDEYSSAVQDIREALAKKPDWADAAIAVWLNQESIREYAARTGQNENNVTQKLKRAKEKLKKFFENRQITYPPVANR